MKKNFPVVLLLTVLISLHSCTNKHFIVPDLPPSGNSDQSIDTAILIKDTSLCFQRDVLPIFIGKCAMSGCHDAVTREKGYVLTTYASIVAKGLVPGHSAESKVYTECVNGKMPPYPMPRLDSTQYSDLRKWIDRGAHNDTTCAIVCDTSKFTYSSIVVPSLRKYCYSCHASTSASASGGGVILDNYTSLRAQAQNGKLLGDLEHLPGYNAMPLGESKLSDCMIIQIKKWIEAGALNN